MSDVTATTDEQPTLESLVQQLQAMRARPWIEFTNLEEMRWNLALDLLLGLASAVIALQSAEPAPIGVSMAEMEQAIQTAVGALPPSVTSADVQSMVAGAVAAAFGKLETAAAPASAPAEEAPSGAAPEPVERESATTTTN